MRILRWMAALLVLLIVSVPAWAETGIVAATCGHMNVTDVLLDGDPSTFLSLRSAASEGSAATVLLVVNNASVSDVWLRTGDVLGMPRSYDSRGMRLQIALHSLRNGSSGVVYDYWLPRTEGQSSMTWDQHITLPQVHTGISVVTLTFTSSYGFNGYDAPAMLLDAAVSAGGMTPASASYEVWGVLKMRLATRTGPSTNYTEPGAFLDEGDPVRVVSKAYDDRNGIWWVQVEFEYHDEMVRAYTGVKRVDCDLDMVPEESCIGSVWIPGEIPHPAYGPGSEYRTFQASVPAGISCDVIGRERGWVQIEYFDEARGLYRRVWVPESKTQGM